MQQESISGGESQGRCADCCYYVCVLSLEASLGFSVVEPSFIQKGTCEITELTSLARI